MILKLVPPERTCEPASPHFPVKAPGDSSESPGAPCGLASAFLEETLL